MRRHRHRPAPHDQTCFAFYAPTPDNHPYRSRYAYNDPPPPYRPPSTENAVVVPFVPVVLKKGPQ